MSKDSLSNSYLNTSTSCLKVRSELRPKYCWVPNLLNYSALVCPIDSRLHTLQSKRVEPLKVRTDWHTNDLVCPCGLRIDSCQCSERVPATYHLCRPCYL